MGFSRSPGALVVGFIDWLNISRRHVLDDGKQCDSATEGGGLEFHGSGRLPEGEGRPPPPNPKGPSPGRGAAPENF